ncbi:MAG TPA: ATP-binding SpoIIE family protein phosphatase [Longimicrobiaceae bacterium]
MSRTLYIPVTESSQAGEARREVARLARALGLDETDTGRAALVATELAGNLVKHAAGGGHLLAQPAREEGRAGIELVALDGGPGIGNVAQALRDGFSTAGTPGTGLGAVSRVADDFDLHSASGVGTAVLARVWAGGRPGQPEPLPVGGVALPKPGQEACGDAWVARPGEAGRVWLLVADGLGHGPQAAEASGEAVRVFAAALPSTPADALERMHGALRGTRGAAASVAEVDPARGVVRFAGVGNVAAAVVVAGGASQSLVSHNGIVGHEMRKVQEFEYRFPPGALLVLCSDGVGTRWTLDRYPGLAARDPLLVAGVLLRDFARGTDDATVAVLRAAAP